MITLLFISTFVVCGLIISNWINQNYLTNLGIPLHRSTSVLGAFDQPLSFWSSLQKTFQFIIKFLIWILGLSLPIISLLTVVFLFIKKIITK